MPNLEIEKRLSPLDLIVNNSLFSPTVVLLVVGVLAFAVGMVAFMGGMRFAFMCVLVHIN